MTKRTPRALRAALFASAALGAFAWASECAALPTGGTITGTSGGGVTITTTGTTTTVASGAHRALIDWTTFTVAQGETVAFTEPDKDAIVVNREINGSMYINGAITSTVGGNVGGNVWFIDPNGIVFGPNADINVGGLLATTANLVNDYTFLSGGDNDPIAFATRTNNPAITIDAGASITVNDGTAAFIGGAIADYGTIKGTGHYQTDTKAVLATAKDFTIQFSSNPPDALRATDLALFDLTVTRGGSNIQLFSSSTTTAGQVILDNVVDPTIVATGVNEINGATVIATGDRGDGFDLVMFSGNIAGDTPSAAAAPNHSEIYIDSSGGGGLIQSAGGMYLSADDVGINAGLDYNTMLMEATGPVSIHANYTVNIANIGNALDPTITAGGNVYLREYNGPMLVGDVTAAGNIHMLVTYAGHTGNLSAGGDVYALIEPTADLTIGDISAGTDVNLLTPGAGDVTAGNITAGVEVSLRTQGSGNITAGDVAGNIVLIRSYAYGGNVQVGDVSATTGPGQVSVLNYGANKVSVGNITATGDVTVEGLGAGAIRVGDISSYYTVRVSSDNGALTAGNVSGSQVYVGVYGAGALTLGTVSAKYASVLSHGTGALTTGNISVTGAVNVEAYDAGAIQVGNVSAGYSVILYTDGGRLSTGGIDAGSYVRATARGAGALDVGDVSALGGVSISSGGTGAVSFGNVTAGTSFLATSYGSGDFTFENVKAGTSFLATSYGSANLTFGNISAGTYVTMVSNGAVVAGDIGGGNVTIRSSGPVTVGDVTATDAFYFDGYGATGSLTTGNVTAGNMVFVIAFGDGSINMEDVSGGYDVLLRSYGAGAVDARNIVSGYNTVILSRGDGPIHTGNISAGGQVDVVSEGDGAVVTGDITADSLISIRTYGAGDATTGNLSSGSFVQMLAHGDGGLNAGDINAQGFVALETYGKGAIDTGNISTSGQVALQTHGAGGITTGDIFGYVAVTVAAFGDGPIHVGNVSSGDNVYLQSEGTGGIVAGNINGGSIAITSTSPIHTGYIDAESDLTIHATGAATVYTGDLDVPDIEITSYRDVTLGNVRAEGSLTVRTYHDSYSAAIAISNIDAGAVDVRGAGNVTVGNVYGSGNISIVAGDDLRTGYLTSPAYVDVGAGHDATIGAVNSLDFYANTSADLYLTGAINVETAEFVAQTLHVLAPITATANAGPRISAGYLGEIEIEANYVDIQAPITSVDAGGTGMIVFFSLNPNGVVVGDNVANPTGLQISNTEFGELSADWVFVDEVSPTAGVRIGDLTVDASKTPNLSVGAGTNFRKDNTVSIEGTMTGIGDPNLFIGPAPVSPLFAYYLARDYAPAHIVISGAIGTTANPFGTVSLSTLENFASNVLPYSIIIGSQAFANEVQTGTTSQFFEPGLGGIAEGHVFIAADDVVLSSGGVILQQNTSPNGGGLDITGSLTIGGGPSEVNLFGVLPDGKGGELTGGAAASSPDLIVSPYAYAPAPEVLPYRFNGCEFGGGDCQPISGVPTAYATPPLYAPVAGSYTEAAPTTIRVTGNGNGATSTGAPSGAPNGVAIGPLVVLPSALADAPSSPQDDHDAKARKKAKKSAESGLANEDHWPGQKQ